MHPTLFKAISLLLWLGLLSSLTAIEGIDPPISYDELVLNPHSINAIFQQEGSVKKTGAYLEGGLHYTRDYLQFNTSYLRKELSLKASLTTREAPVSTCLELQRKQHCLSIIRQTWEHKPEWIQAELDNTLHFWKTTVSHSLVWNDTYSLSRSQSQITIELPDVTPYAQGDIHETGEWLVSTGIVIPKEHWTIAVGVQRESKNKSFIPEAYFSYHPNNSLMLQTASTVEFRAMPLNDNYNNIALGYRQSITNFNLLIAPELLRRNTFSVEHRLGQMLQKLTLEYNQYEQVRQTRWFGNQYQLELTDDQINHVVNYHLRFASLGFRYYYLSGKRAGLAPDTIYSAEFRRWIMPWFILQLQANREERILINNHEYEQWSAMSALEYYGLRKWSFILSVNRKWNDFPIAELKDNLTIGLSVQFGEKK
ncbi:MAG: hypothetical protein K8S56_07160 [Candidatus Cloacimonetes bacterium]|nr:hypothetical protein [Candidatus Cloacimonadota bacterium]